jgi:hypothetical protein
MNGDKRWGLNRQTKQGEQYPGPNGGLNETVPTRTPYPTYFESNLRLCMFKELSVGVPCRHRLTIHYGASKQLVVTAKNASAVGLTLCRPSKGSAVLVPSTAEPK